METDYLETDYPFHLEPEHSINQILNQILPYLAPRVPIHSLSAPRLQSVFRVSDVGMTPLTNPTLGR